MKQHHDQQPNLTVLKPSPSHDTRDLIGASFNGRVNIYEERITGWLLCWAQELNKHEHGGFAALQLALSFFEGIAVYNYGEDSRDRSKDFFKRGFRLIFPWIDRRWPRSADGILSQFCHSARCGLFHLGMARPGVILFDTGDPFNVRFDRKGNITRIEIDRHGFVEGYWLGHLALRKPGRPRVPNGAQDQAPVTSFGRRRLSVMIRR